MTVEMNDPKQRLRPGMFARIHIIYDIHQNVLLVPKDAVQSEDKEAAVYIIRDTVAYRQQIKTGYVNTTNIEVLEGLKDGDTIVTTGKGSLKDSTKVEIISN